MMEKKSANRLDIEKSFTSNVWNGSLTSIANKTRSICESVLKVIEFFGYIQFDKINSVYKKIKEIAFKKIILFYANDTPTKKRKQNRQCYHHKSC